MQKKYNEIMQEVDARMATIDLKGANIVADSRTMIQFLKEKLAEMKVFLFSHPFESEAEEIVFFKYLKPKLVGRLIYFYKIFRIESISPKKNRLWRFFSPLLWARVLCCKDAVVLHETYLAVTLQ